MSKQQNATVAAIRQSFIKLDPRAQTDNPVMFMVYLSAIMTTILWICALAGVTTTNPVFVASVCVVLWLTVLFGNFAEALAQGRGKAQADSLRAAKRDVTAHKITQGEAARGMHEADPVAFF